MSWREYAAFRWRRLWRRFQRRLWLFYWGWRTVGFAVRCLCIPFLWFLFSNNRRQHYARWRLGHWLARRNIRRSLFVRRLIIAVLRSASFFITRYVISRSRILLSARFSLSRRILFTLRRRLLTG